MAYRRGSGNRSRVRRVRAKEREKRKVRGALTDLEIAKQHEARSRDKNKNLGALIGAIIAGAIGFSSGGIGAGPAAAWIAGGSAGGELNYQASHSGGRKTRIEKARDALLALEDEQKFRETREAASEGATVADIAHEGMQADVGSMLSGFGTDWMKYYMMTSGLQKGADKSEFLGKIFGVKPR